MWIGTARDFTRLRKDPLVATQAALIEPTHEQVLEFCSRDPVERVFLEDVARRGLGHFYGVGRGDGRLEALCHAGANLVPSGEGCARFADAAAGAASRMIIGEEQAVTELWEAVRDRVPSPREDRPGQPVYALREPPEAGDTGLRPATLFDLDLLVPVCATAHAEELGVDPLERDADGFRWRTRAQIDDGRSWVWLEHGVIRFKAEASAWTPAAVQIQQVWVDPEVRREGYGKRGMRDLCRLLLQSTPTVTLFVRTDNAPAIRLYESIGMARVGSYRSVLF
jgi:ribosomal protein S18 acetylase RimI-like enzyme